MNQQSALYAGGGTSPACPAGVNKSAAHSRKWLTLALVAGLAIASTGCAKLKSRDQMNQGVQAYRDAHYAEAVDHFKQAVQLDPTNKNALEYLATSYFTQWVPGAESANNKKNLEMAQQTFQEVLNKYPNDSLALATMAAMAYNVAVNKPNDEEKAAALEDARKWNERRIKADPNDSEAYYYLGVIDWMQADAPIRKERAAEKMPSDDPGPLKDKKVRQELKDKYGQKIERGLQEMHKALDIDKENEDAMNYINLLLRSKAALEDTPEEAKADAEQANNWFNKSLATKKMKATRPKKNQES